MYLFMDVVKIDVLGTPPELLSGMVTEFKKYPAKLLAERVETTEQFRDCLELGFELFQGYFFERPVVLKRKGLEPSKISVLKLMDSLQGEMDIEDIEEVFRSYPDLSYNMLKLVNSVSSNRREKIKGLRHAIMMLGLDKLRRWVQLAIFASSDNRGINNPLLEMAAVRGRLIEYLIMQRHSLPRGNETVEAAFMTGILSLLDVLFETSMEEIVREFRLSESITTALLNREGELGGLLALAETLEMVNFGEVQELVGLAKISLPQLLDAQMVAYNWRASLMISGN
jgi:c-di-GMP-related signal transduction protein